MKIHYLDWAEKIRKKYSQIGEYGFAGATLTFLQGEKHSEPQNGGEERRLMLFFQNLIFCWENSIGVKLSIGNERVLEKSVRLALETAIQKLTSEEKTHFSREVKIARELLEGKEKTEIQMQKSLVFRRWQEGYSWEEISGHREIREYAERLEETRNQRQELARIRNREIARIQSKEMELAQIQNMKEVQNADETRIQNQYMRQHPGMEIRTNETKGSLLEKMQDQSNLVHREANETLGEREVRLNKTESQLETVRLEKREQESRLETIRLEKREQESQLETIRLEKREQESRLEIPSEKVQPEPRDTQPELQKMQTELNRQQEKLTETQIQLEKEAQILKHPENSLVHLEPEQKPEHPESSLMHLEPEKKPEHPESSLVYLEPEQKPERPESSLVHLEPEQKPEHPESSLVHLEPEQKPEHPESSLVYLEPEQKPERPEGSLLHRKSKKAPDESRQDKAKILLNNLSESTSQRKKQPENRLFPGAVERMEKNVKTMEKVLERFHVVTETRKSVFSEPHIVEKHSNVRLEKLVSETLQQKQEKIRTAALQQNHRVRTIKRIIPRLEVLPGNREMRLEILETAEKTSGYETGQEFTSLPELSTTAKIQYTVPENRKTDRTNVGSEVSAISATLAQTREETRILRKNTGYTRTALIEQEKKIDGIRKELNTQMKQVNEEVRRLMDTQRRDMSVQNLAGKVMKELQRQFRTEKIRRGY